ncbi:unnamed protein product, partial [Iphiclides podalirius]
MACYDVVDARRQESFCNASDPGERIAARYREPLDFGDAFDTKALSGLQRCLEPLVCLSGRKTVGNRKRSSFFLAAHHTSSPNETCEGSEGGGGGARSGGYQARMRARRVGRADPGRYQRYKRSHLTASLARIAALQRYHSASPAALALSPCR